jgi:hypothetical protein
MNDETLFNMALELPAAERAAFLEKECGDGAQRQRVEDLLHAHDNPGGFLGQPPVSDGIIGSRRGWRHDREVERQILIEFIGAPITRRPSKHTVTRIIRLAILCGPISDRENGIISNRHQHLGHQPSLESRRRVELLLTKFVQDLPGWRCAEMLKDFHGPCGTQCLGGDLWTRGAWGAPDANSKGSPGSAEKAPLADYLRKGLGLL